MKTVRIDTAIGEWVRSRVPKVEAWQHGFQAIGFYQGDTLVCGVVYDGFTPYECNMHIAKEIGVKAEDLDCVEAFKYPFSQLKLERVTAQIEASNMRAIAFAEKLGFRFEGRKRRAFGDEDELIFGMLRSECKFL